MTVLEISKGFSAPTNVGNGDLTTAVAFGKLLSAGLLILLPVGSVCLPNGVGEFGGASGRSRTDSDLWSPTEPKRRSLGKAVALRDRGQKLYPWAGPSDFPRPRRILTASGVP